MIPAECTLIERKVVSEEETRRILMEEREIILYAEKPFHEWWEMATEEFPELGTRAIVLHFTRPLFAPVKIADEVVRFGKKLIVYTFK